MKSFLTLLFILSSMASYGQHDAEEDQDHEEPRGRHKIAVFTGTSWVPEGRNHITGEKETVLAPTWGFAYEYWFSHKWAVGTYCDVEFVNAIVEREGGEQVRRENVRVYTIGATYEPIPRWTIYAGIGGENDAHERIFVGRLTTEYAVIEHDGWEGAISISWLTKDFYDVLSAGFVLGKRF